LNQAELDNANRYLEELDKVGSDGNKFAGEFNPATIKYENVLIQLYRDIEDPFENQLVSLKFTQNPDQPSLLLKDVEFAADVQVDESSGGI
jgi:hypothetical protein